MERHAESRQHLQERGEPGIAVLAEGFAKGLARDGCHAASAGNNAEGLGDVSCIAAGERIVPRYLRVLRSGYSVPEPN